MLHLKFLKVTISLKSFAIGSIKYNRYFNEAPGSTNQDLSLDPTKICKI